MKKTKVYVYIKPSSNTTNQPLGIIKTDQTGNIIKKEEKKKEEKELDIEKIIEKTIEKKQDEVEKKNNKVERDEKKEREKKDLGLEKNNENIEEKYITFLKILEQEKILFENFTINYNSPLIEQVELEKVESIVPDPNIDKNDPVAVLEAALFMAVDGLSIEALAKLIGKRTQETQKLVEQLQQKYNANNSAIEISNELKNKWVMRIKPSYAPAVKQFAKEADITKHSLKTLAFIAKNENITKRELFKKLGSQIYEDVKELEEKGFIKTIPTGRTSKIKLTEKFNQYFGL
ncbi:MAG: SMC-Scp complex subunit ScpB [Candidatus Anstonellaceae archaeon]